MRFSILTLLCASLAVAGVLGIVVGLMDFNWKACMVGNVLASLGGAGFVASSWRDERDFPKK